MSGVIHTVSVFLFALILFIVPWPGNTSAQEPDSAVDPETWVYESIVKDGKLQFEDFNEWAGSQSKDYRPLTLFVRSKLGCKPIMDADWKDNLAGDWLWKMTGAPIAMTMLDGQYVIAEGRMYKAAGSRGLMILDIVNRWAAFAMTHSEDHWRFEDGGRRGIVYSEAYQRDYSHKFFSLFLVDHSSEMFTEDAKLIARIWVEGYGFGGKEGFGKDGEFRYYPDDIPVNVHEIRCSDAG